MYSISQDNVGTLLANFVRLSSSYAKRKKLLILVMKFANYYPITISLHGHASTHLYVKKSLKGLHFN